MKNFYGAIRICGIGGMADVPVLEAGALGVWVQVPHPAPSVYEITSNIRMDFFADLL